MSAGILDTVVHEIAQMKLPKINGFAANEANRALLIGLADGAWIKNAALSKERSEVAELILEELAKKALPVLQRHLPGKLWTVKWENDTEAYFDGRSTVLSFRWSD